MFDPPDSVYDNEIRQRVLVDALSARGITLAGPVDDPHVRRLIGVMVGAMDRVILAYGRHPDRMRYAAATAQLWTHIYDAYAAVADDLIRQEAAKGITELAEYARLVDQQDRQVRPFIAAIDDGSGMFAVRVGRNGPVVARYGGHQFALERAVAAVRQYLARTESDRG